MLVRSIYNKSNSLSDRCRRRCYLRSGRVFRCYDVLYVLQLTLWLFNITENKKKYFLHLLLCVIRDGTMFVKCTDGGSPNNSMAYRYFIRRKLFVHTSAVTLRTLCGDYTL